ncbi:uncharacterized protein VTP21DRAFT_3680 [Calcarisporiella thermophila]|uniref:uncharacterized protein n=1 Tax=Calcarisporiella thermophila TaxID=911321 RepID=UPI003743A27F
MDPPPSHMKIQRVRQACHGCRLKKQKCDGDLDGCSRCRLVGIKCTYGNSLTRRGRPRSLFLQQNEKILFKVTQNQVQKRGSLAPLHVLNFDRYFSGMDISSWYPAYSPILLWKWAENLHFSRSPGTYFTTSEMLSLIIQRMSSLSVADRPSKVVPRSTANEPKKSELALVLFDHLDPLKSISFQQAIALINAWFVRAGFPTVICRSQMIQNYGTRQMDPFLYAAFFGNAAHISGIQYDGPSSGKRGSLFIDYAFSLLEKQPDEVSLTRLQGLFILAGHMIAIGYTNKGLLLMKKAIEVAKCLRIPDHDYDDSHVDPIERELRNNVWWAIRITSSWGLFHRGKRVLDDLLLPVRLPVKSENESAIFLADRSTCYFSFPEHGQMIRSFYNCAYLTRIFTNIWQYTVPVVSNHSSLYPPISKTEHADLVPGPPQELEKFMSSYLHKTMREIPGDIDPMGAAELLINLNILVIHSHFPKVNDHDFGIEDDILLECENAADAILALAELILNNQNSLPLHSVIILGLNTSACVYSYVAGSGSEKQNREALVKLRKTLQLLKGNRIVYHDTNLIDTLKDIVARTENEQLRNLYEKPNQIPPAQIIIPRVYFNSVANVDLSNDSPRYIIMKAQPIKSQTLKQQPLNMQDSILTSTFPVSSMETQCNVDEILAASFGLSHSPTDAFSHLSFHRGLMSSCEPPQPSNLITEMPLPLTTAIPTQPYLDPCPDYQTPIETPAGWDSATYDGQTSREDENSISSVSETNFSPDPLIYFLSPLKGNMNLMGAQSTESEDLKWKGSSFLQEQELNAGISLNYGSRRDSKQFWHF